MLACAHLQRLSIYCHGLCEEPFRLWSRTPASLLDQHPPQSILPLCPKSRLIFPGKDLEGASICPFCFREEALPFFSTAPHALFNQHVPQVALRIPPQCRPVLRS